MQFCSKPKCEDEDDDFSDNVNYLKATNTVYLSGIITEETAARVNHIFLENLSHCNNARPFNFIIDSCGGECLAALSMYDVMQMVKETNPIRTIVSGKAFSAGTILAVSGTKGQRYMTENSFMMLHSLSYGSSGKLADNANELKYTQQLQEVLNRIYISSTKITKKSKIFKDVIVGKDDLYLDAKASLEIGLVDHVLSPKEFNNLLYCK